MCTFFVHVQNMCTHYWPDLEDTKVYGWIQVVNLKETPKPHYILREFLVHHKEVRWSGAHTFTQ